MIQGDPRTLCPICSSPSEPVLTDAHVFVRRGSTKKVGAELRVFHCDAASHIFFVRSEDLARAFAHLSATEVVKGKCD